MPVGLGGLGPALAGKAGREVEVGLGDWTVLLRAVDSDRPTYHAAWCADNRRRVRAATGGRVGYLHLPDFGAHGYARFREAMLTEGTLDGLGIDVRGNEGGHASWLVVEHTGSDGEVFCEAFRVTGLDPDHVVLAPPHDDPACADPQLDRAAALVLDRLGESGFPACRFRYGEFKGNSEGDR